MTRPSPAETLALLADVRNAVDTWTRVHGPVETLLAEPRDRVTSAKGEVMVRLPTSQRIRSGHDQRTEGAVHQHDAWVYQDEK